MVRRAIEHLQRNLVSPVTLRDLEVVTARNSYQIIRAFHRELGTTPHAYLVDLRVKYAASLLLGGETIAGAAGAAGFADQSHLARHFKRLYGTTPGRFVRG